MSYLQRGDSPILAKMEQGTFGELDILSLMRVGGMTDTQSTFLAGTEDQHAHVQRACILLPGLYPHVDFVRIRQRLPVVPHTWFPPTPRTHVDCATEHGLEEGFMICMSRKHELLLGKTHSEESAGQAQAPP